jgi:hypothetical protein
VAQVPVEQGRSLQATVAVGADVGTNVAFVGPDVGADVGNNVVFVGDDVGADVGVELGAAVVGTAVGIFVSQQSLHWVQPKRSKTWHVVP